MYGKSIVLFVMNSFLAHSGAMLLNNLKVFSLGAKSSHSTKIKLNEKN